MSSNATKSNTEKPRAKVLVVDNERVIADSLAMILSIHGYQCFAAYDGLTGLQKAREVQPDMIISDVVHEGLNGIEMAIQIRAEMPDTRILLFSGQATTADVKAGAEMHGFPLLAKPVHPQELLNWLESGGKPDAFGE